MRGFPNHAGELLHIAIGINCFADIETEGRDGADHGMIGEALVREGVGGTGHAVHRKQSEI